MMNLAQQLRQIATSNTTSLAQEIYEKIVSDATEKANERILKMNCSFDYLYSRIGKEAMLNVLKIVKEKLEEDGFEITIEACMKGHQLDPVPMPYLKISWEG